MFPVVPAPFPKTSIGWVVIGGTVKPEPDDSKVKICAPPLLSLLILMKLVSPVTEPLWLSPAAGAALPSSSMPWPRADQTLAPTAAVNVQVKSCETVAARVTLAGLKDEQAPPPVTFTFVNVPLPVLVSVTTIVTGSPVLTDVGALFRVSEVEVVTPRTEPLWLSPSAGAALPR